MKIALFGGTFDPVHNGHVELWRACAHALSLDKLILMPTAQPPHKLKAEMAPAAHRAAMCELAAADDAYCTVSRVEIARGGSSFTADTLDILADRYPQAEWFLLMGADMFLTVSTWFRFADIAARATLCTVPRDGISAQTLETHAEKLRALGARCHVVDAPIPTVSSTEIRSAIRAEQSGWQALVPPAVATYITEHELYLPDRMDAIPTDDEQFTDILRRRLTPYRFEHSLAVAREAKRLAPLYGADPQKAYTAGLLHDIMKDAPPAEQMQVMENFHSLPDAETLEAPKLWHAAAGAVFLEHILGITDRDMLNAVRYHTTGRAGMSPLEQTVYIADFTAEGRHYPDVETMRRRANLSAAEGMLYALQYSVNDLKRKGRPSHPDTLAALRELRAAKKPHTERTRYHGKR